MFVVSDISKLRVYVNVPQNYVPAIKIGAKAMITMPEYPNRTFAATVEASSQSVDVSSGTTRMQLALDNANGELMPGGYANVKLSLQRDAVPLHIPASALIFNQNGLRVATVGPDDKVLFKTVTIARDLGRDIELASGLAPDDRIIIAPPDGIADGDQVRVAGGKGSEPKKVSEKQEGLPRTQHVARMSEAHIRDLRRVFSRMSLRSSGYGCPPLQYAVLGGDDVAERADRRAVHVEQMRQRLGVARGHPCQRPPVVLGAQHGHAVLDLAVAAIDHGEGLDLALAAGFGDELRHLAAIAVGFRLHAGVLRQRLLRRLARQHQAVMFGDKAALAVEQAELARRCAACAPSRRPHASCRC